MSVNTIENHKIKAILFDLGGVLLNIDYELTERAFIDLGVLNFDEIYSQARQNALFDDFEVGKISGQDFTNGLSRYLPTKHKSEVIRKAWNAMLLDFPSHRIEMIKALKFRFKVMLLSNTNEIHYKAFNASFEHTYKFYFSSLFEKAYYSHLMGKRKPNHEAFLQILNEQSLKSEEVLFIDDSIQHVDAASKLGIQSVLLEKGVEVSSLLSSIGVLT